MLLHHGPLERLGAGGSTPRSQLSPTVAPFLGLVTWSWIQDISNVIISKEKVKQDTTADERADLYAHPVETELLFVFSSSHRHVALLF